MFEVVGSWERATVPPLIQKKLASLLLNGCELWPFLFALPNVVGVGKGGCMETMIVGLATSLAAMLFCTVMWVVNPKSGLERMKR